MQIQGAEDALVSWNGDALAIGLTEESLELSAELAHFDSKISGDLSTLLKEEEFDGKAKSVLVTRISGQSPIRKLIVVGLGKAEELQLTHFRNAAAKVARLVKKEKVKSLGIYFPSLLALSEKEKNYQAIAESVLLALHQDNRFKSDPEEKDISLETVELIGLEGNSPVIEQATIVAEGVIFARELVAAPANVITPQAMADIAQNIANQHGLSLQILEQADCKALGMGAYLGVGQASDLPPKFIHLTYQPQGNPRRKLAIIGKSVTFDSGGLNLKGSGSGIETMKMDMAGGAATLAAAQTIARLKPDNEVHFICAATENMISGSALHPGDIINASNGKTIEINNTDAEGRLTLADALVFAEKLEVDAIIDLATLTGACIVALGDSIAGLWTADETLSTEIKTAADAAGEKFWQMPMENKYFDGLKSPIADMKNTGPRAGGSITAALFLNEFVEKTPWAHLDIAGPVWNDKEDGMNNAGATGFPVRTLVNWVLS